MKVFVAGVSQETNTFATTPTSLGAFGVVRQDHARALAGSEWAAAIVRLAAAEGHELTWGLVAEAPPLGTVVRGAYESMRDELLAGLRAALPVHAVILPIHGAMVADGYPDCEGDLVAHVRGLVGPDVAIGVEVDPHCHYTERMRTCADLVVAYKEYPHTDVVERLEEVWTLTLATAQRRIRPVTSAFDCRMTTFWHTTREPMKSFVRRMQSLEGRDGVLSVSFGHGFPWGDVPEAGGKVWVVTDGRPEHGAALAEQLARELWSIRASTLGHEMSLAAALERLATHTGDRPLVLADLADNPGGGADGDSTFVLRGVLERGIGNVALGGFRDPGAIQVCRDAGVGARLRLRLGGKCGPASGDPVDLDVRIRAFVEEHTQSVGGFRWGCGPSTWVSTDEGVDLVIVSARVQVYGRDLFGGLGVDLAAKRGIVVKSSQHFHHDFAPIAAGVLYVDTPGLLRSDFAGIPYRHRDPNYWPRVADPHGWEGGAAAGRSTAAAAGDRA
jgi:microcystin degradation protein MlrC